MSASSDLCKKGEDLQPSIQEDKNVANPTLESKLTNNASLPSSKSGNATDVLYSIKDSMMCTEEGDVIDEFLASDNTEEDKSSLLNDQEQLAGSRESSESEDLYLVLSDEGETDNQTDTDKCDEDNNNNANLNENEAVVEQQSGNIDSTDSNGKTSDNIPFEETLTCDLHVSENHNSECSTDSSDLLKLTTEEEKICSSTNDNILDDDDALQEDQESEVVKSGLNSSELSENSPVVTDSEKLLKEQSAKSNADESSTNNISTCQDLEDVVEGLKGNHTENLEGSSNSNTSGSTELESRSVTEAAISKNQVVVDSGVSCPSVEHQQPTADSSPAAKNETVPEVDDAIKHVEVDISSTLPCGLFKDDSLEEFSLSPKDSQSHKSNGVNPASDVNGLSETDQGMSIEDIIDNLSSPIGEDGSSMVDESASGKGEAESVTEVSPTDNKISNKRAPDPDSLSNDRVEVKKVKLDIVYSEKSADIDPENSDEGKNVTSSTASVEEEKENIDINGDVTKMDVVCDDDIDVIEEKYFEQKEESPSEKTVEPNLDEKKIPVVQDKKPEIKVNGIATDLSDDDVKNQEVVHLTEENIDELVIKRISDMFYEDHINTVAALTKKVETLERNLEKSKKRLSYYQSMLGNLSTEHRRQLAKLGYLPKVHTRTVGVNVRILQEHELQSTNRLRMVKDGLVPPVTSATSIPSTPALTNTAMQLAQATAKKCILPRAATPGGLTSGPRMPAPNVTVSQITVNTPGLGNDDKLRAPSSMQIIPNVSQGMASPPSMMNRPRMQPSILRRQPVPKSPGSGTSTASIVLLSNPAPNTSTVASSINVIDLTEDGDSSLTTTTAATSQSSAMLVSPSVTRGPSSSLVPMPLVGSLNSVVQIIPSGSHMSSSISGGNAIRVGRPPAVLPNSTCLPQGPRVAYLLQQNPGTIVMPRMDGQVSQIGNLQPHQSPFVTSSGHVPTILVRMNAPPSNTAPTVSSNAVSTTKPTISQSNAPVSLPSGNTPSSTMLISCVAKHPAPLPPAPSYPENKNWKCLPPKPALKISKVSNGIVLSWNMSLFNSHAEIATYQLYAYQESNQAVTSSLWKKVGNVKALPLPMACTLTQFVEGHKYHFAVRAVDIHNRIGPFSDPSSIVLLPRSGQIPSK